MSFVVETRSDERLAGGINNVVMPQISDASTLAQTMFLDAPARPNAKR